MILGVNIDKRLQDATKVHESQFKRVKLPDKIFTPDGIRTLKGTNTAVNLRLWLRGNVAGKPFGQADVQFLKSFQSVLKDEFKVDDFISKINELAEKL